VVLSLFQSEVVTLPSNITKIKEYLPLG